MWNCGRDCVAVLFLFKDMDDFNMDIKCGNSHMATFFASNINILNKNVKIFYGFLFQKIL